MNDLPTLPDHSGAPAATNAVVASTVPPASAPPVQPTGTTVYEMLQKPINLVVLILLALLLAAHAWSTRNNIQRLRVEMAKSLQKGEMINAETSTLARSVHDIARDLQAKVTLLESRQVEAQGQQLALEQLYQDLSKNRDEWALAEIEQVLSTASQQLQLAGNVQGALIAVDTLPMLSDETPARPAPPVRPVRAKASASAARPASTTATAHVDDSIWGRTQETWRAWSHEMWSEMRELVRVRRVDTPAALMLAPNEAYFLRENLKLRLLNARLALMSRNESAFRADLTAAQDSLVKYFDIRAGATQAAQAQLRQVQANNLAIEMPSLSDSLNAVRNYKTKP